MRLSGLFVTLAFLVSSTVVVCAQHGGSSSGGGGGSHGGGGVSSSAGSVSGGHVSSGSGSHVSSSTTTHTSPSAKLSSGKETQSKGPSFFHPFRKPEPVVATKEFERPCLHGACAVCPPGFGRNGGGMCSNTRNACQNTWSTFACGTQAWMYRDCSSLAAQLEAQRRQMRGSVDTGQSII